MMTWIAFGVIRSTSPQSPNFPLYNKATVATTWPNIQFIEFMYIWWLSVERQRQHGRISPRACLQLHSKSPPPGPRQGSRWSRCNQHQSHRWRKWYHQPLQLVTVSLVKEALHPPPPSTPGCCHWSRRPPGWNIFFFFKVLQNENVNGDMTNISVCRLTI